MIQLQQTMISSPYLDINSIVVPKDNLSKKINENMKETFPSKCTIDVPEDEINYCQKLM